jgi:hypothetical protein
MSQGDLRVEFARLRAQYAHAGITQASTATSIPMLVDSIVRARLRAEPRLDYRTAVEEIFRKDPALKKAYGQS